MKRIAILLWVLIFVCSGCRSKTAKPDSIAADSVDSVDDAGVDNAPAIAPSLSGLIKSMDTIGQALPSEYCELLGIVPCMDLTSCMEVKNIGDNRYVLALTASKGATATETQAQIILLEFNPDKILHLSSFELVYQKPPVYVFLHNTFFLAEMEMKEYEENEAGAMSDTGKPPWIQRECFVLFNEKFSPITAYSKSELQIIRNLIFARYGYQFKSDSLKNYFSKYDWYKPVSKNVDDKLTDTDKVLINLIQAEEASKK